MKYFTKEKLFRYFLSLMVIVSFMFVVSMVGVCTRIAIKSKVTRIPLAGEWKIRIGDNMEYASPAYDDSTWDTHLLPANMIQYALRKGGSLKGIIWLRKTVRLDSDLPEEGLGLILGRMANADQTYLNGTNIGSMGIFPPCEFSMWYHTRYYEIPESLIRRGANNVLAVRLSYNIFCEVLGTLAITDMTDWKKSRAVTEFLLIQINYLFIAAGSTIFFIIFFFYIRKLTAFEYLFSCLQLISCLIILLEPCNYWNFYGDHLTRLKVLAVAWLSIALFHTLFLHRIYEWKRRKIEIALSVYAVASLFFIFSIKGEVGDLLPVIMFILFSMVIGVYNVVSYLAALAKRSPYALLYSLFGLSLTLGGIHDALIYISKISGYKLDLLGYTFQYMMFPYSAGIMFMGTILVFVSRFIGTADEIETMNVKLERMVLERTEELLSAMEETEATNEQLSLARDALQGEMDVAKRIQTMLLPKEPAIPDYVISAYMRTAVAVGGDYYDVISAGGKNWLIIGDVSGHGVPAGLIMMMVQTAVQTVIKNRPEIRPAELLSLVNDAIRKNMRQMEEFRYMTIIAFAVSEDGGWRFAGLHEEIMVYRAGAGSVELVPTSGVFLGLQDNIESIMGDEYLRLEPGDAMLLYTDGITEAWRWGSVRDHRDAERDQYGVARLSGVFQDLGACLPEEIKRGVIDSLHDYECDDDVTMVVVKRLAQVGQ
ncbi:MAG: serine/threonine-protein phosphatase [Spirochaetes bacterium]|nr:serine/threonine-protein phosphatase [Spirochaetota bacterium]